MVRDDGILRESGIPARSAPAGPGFDSLYSGMGSCHGVWAGDLSLAG